MYLCSLFHNAGPATPKALLLMTVDLVNGTLSGDWLSVVHDLDDTAL